MNRTLADNKINTANTTNSKSNQIKSKFQIWKFNQKVWIHSSLKSIPSLYPVKGENIIEVSV